MLDAVLADPGLTPEEVAFLECVPDLHKASEADFEISAGIVERWLHRHGWSQTFGIRPPTYH